MAPRRHLPVQQEAPVLRRSARLRATDAAPATDVLAAVHASESRITKLKPKPTPKPKKLDCVTCGRALSRSSFPKAATPNCSHDMTTCKQCLKAWIAAQLDSTTYDKMSCPECPEILANADVKAGAAKEVYNRFVELERRGISDKIPGWRWCLAPDCNAGQVHQALVDIQAQVKGKKAKRSRKHAGGDICVCNECGAAACVPCDRPYHEGETCEQFHRRTKQVEKDEKATLKTIEQECKKCPTCNKNIQRNGGCDHMTCSQCRTSFCWLCLLEYNVIDVQGHAKGCTYAQPGRFDPHAHVQLNNGNDGVGGWFLGGLWPALAGQ